MPKVFKALTTISAWVLFVAGAGGMLFSTIDTFTREGGMVGGEPYNFSDASWGALSIVSVLLAVIVIKIRKGLE